MINKAAVLSAMMIAFAMSGCSGTRGASLDTIDWVDAYNYCHASELNAQSSYCQNLFYSDTTDQGLVQPKPPLKPSPFPSPG